MGLKIVVINRSRNEVNPVGKPDIIDRLKELDRLDEYEEIMPIKDWSTERAGGPRKVVREDVRL